jgi:hypothetical protein
VYTHNWRSRVITGIAALAITVGGLAAAAVPARAAEPYAVSTIYPFQDPTAVAMAPDGKVLYVADSGAMTEVGTGPGTPPPSTGSPW